MPKIDITVEEITTRTVVTRKQGTTSIRVPSRDLDPDDLQSFCEELDEHGDLSTPRWGKQMEEPEQETVEVRYTYQNEKDF